MFTAQTRYDNPSISIYFGEMWRRGKINAKSIRVVDIKELALLYDLEDYLVEVDEPLRIDRDLNLFLATKSRRDIFHLALTMVIRRYGISPKDRFFTEGRLFSIEELKRQTITGGARKTSKLDSLFDLMIFAYRRCGFLFKEVAKIESNKELFNYFCEIFSAIHDMLLDQKKNFVGRLHVKAILTTIMQLKDSNSVRLYMQAKGSLDRWV